MYVSPGLGTFLHWCVSAFALLVTAYIVPGFVVESFVAALIAAVVIGFANSTIGFFLMVLTLPLNLVTFGLFTFIVDGIVLKMCAAIVPKFSINGWLAAFFGALILTVVNTLLHHFLI